MLAKASSDYKDSSWRQLNNYEKEKLQFNLIYPLILAEAEKYPNVEARLHFRTKHGKATDADIILLKDGKVKAQIELSNLWINSFKNVGYALNPRRKALLNCPKVEIDDSFKSYYIQNGGRYDPYLRDACKDNNWILYRLPPIHHMTRATIRTIKKIIHQIFIHIISEEQHVYDKEKYDYANESAQCVCLLFDVDELEYYWSDLYHSVIESEYQPYFDQLSLSFDPLMRALYRRHQNEIEAYRQMTGVIPTWTS